MSDKLAVLMEFNGYTKDELEAYLSLKFGSMTKGGMTASILSQSGYEKAKSVIFGQPQLNENQKLLLEDLREIKESQKDKNMLGLIWVLGQRFTTKSNIKSFTDQEILVVLQALEQEEE